MVMIEWDGAREARPILAGISLRIREQLGQELLCSVEKEI